MEFTEPKYLTPATGLKVTGRFEKSPKNEVGGLARVRAKNSSTPALEWREFHWNETNFPGYGLIFGLTLSILKHQAVYYKYIVGEGS